MGFEQIKDVVSSDPAGWANCGVTLVLGIVGSVFVYKQTKILVDQNRIFDKQNEYNNRLIELQERTEKKND